MAQPNQGQDPEWKKLINQLVNLNDKGGVITRVATTAATTINQQALALEAVSAALDAILIKLNSIPSSAQIEEALKTANGDQVKALETLIQDQNNAINPALKTLQANVGSVQTATQSITDAQNPQQPAIGGKRRRRTRSKGKKYHKRTKRGGYGYGNGKGKGKGKKSPKKK